MATFPSPPPGCYKNMCQERSLFSLSDYCKQGPSIPQAFLYCSTSKTLSFVGFVPSDLRVLLLQQNPDCPDWYSSRILLNTWEDGRDTGQQEKAVSMFSNALKWNHRWPRGTKEQGNNLSIFIGPHSCIYLQKNCLVLLVTRIASRDFPERWFPTLWG